MSRIKCDLNGCKPDELAQVDGIDRKLAQRIIEARADKGGFVDYDDLRKIPGVDDAVLERIREQTVLGRPRRG